MKAQHEQEFEEFALAVSGRLLHAGDLLTGSRASAEDLVQHGLAAAYARWPAIREGTPEAYVRRAMLNRHLDWWRRRRWRELPMPAAADDAERLAAAAPGASGGAPDLADQVVRRDAVHRALSQLTRRERTVIVLRFWLDLSEAQIASELRIAPGTVKSTAARALARLRTSPDIFQTEGAPR